VIKWEVSYNDRYGQARQLAYKLDTLVINRKLEEAGRPVPKLIRLGSLREIADSLDMGGNTNHIKRALRQNASAFITLKIAYSTITGAKKTLEADFTRYSVIFTGEKLPDERKADCVYLNLNDVYWSLLNEVPWRPQDYDYLKALPPAAQRFYEIISARFYIALRHNHKTARIAYSEYSAYSGQQRYFDYEHVKKQMYKVHQPHKRSGYLEAVSYESTQDEEGRPDWTMCYIPGPKAKKEYEYFMGRTAAAAPPAKALSEGIDIEFTAAEPHGLIGELMKRGIDDKQARGILADISQSQDVLEQLEYADYRIASAQPGTFRNPPGFYISVLRDNAPVPENFESSRKRRNREEDSRTADAQNAKKLEMENAFAEYKRSEVERYIEQNLSPEEHAAIIDEMQRGYVAQFRNAAQWPSETLRTVASNAALVEVARRVPLLAFDEFCRQHAKS
jgi:hypothetical protein